jgi:hypothetical protein
MHLPLSDVETPLEASCHDRQDDLMERPAMAAKGMLTGIALGAFTWGLIVIGVVAFYRH